MQTNQLLATLIIWLAAAGIFLGGLAPMGWTGWAGGLPWAAASAALFLGAGHATRHVWANVRPSQEARQVDAARDDA